MQQNYRIYQIIILILSILITNYCMLWSFHYFNIKPYPNNEIYILGLSYLTVLIVTAFVASSKNLKVIHSLAGFKKTSLKAITISLFVAIILWLADYLYQNFILKNDLTIEASQWFLLNYKNQTITFITTVIIAPIIEEILLRGILLQSLCRYLNKPLAIIVVSLLFTLLHDSYEQWPTLFIASTLYCWLTLRYKSILPAIAAHILNNALTFMLYRMLVL